MKRFISIFSVRCLTEGVVSKNRSQTALKVEYLSLENVISTVLPDSFCW